MQALNLDLAKAIYRNAVDTAASDSEGTDWWAEVRAELERVVSARTQAEAAQGIAWWHSDWEWHAVGDSAKAAAQRIRAAARAAAH